MKGARYKRTGWYGESHRHYLAAKGIKTGRYNARKKVNPDVVLTSPRKKSENVKVTFVDEPTAYDELVMEDRKARGLDPENVVIKVEGTERDYDIQLEDWVAQKARAVGIKTKEEFMKYEKDFHEGLQARGAELAAARKATVAFAKTLPSRAKAGAEAVKKGSIAAFKKEEEVRKAIVDKSRAARDQFDEALYDRRREALNRKLKRAEVQKEREDQLDRLRDNIDQTTGKLNERQQRMQDMKVQEADLKKQEKIREERLEAVF